MSYIVATEDLTLTDTMRFRQAAVNKGIWRAISLAIVPAQHLLVLLPGATREVPYTVGMDIPGNATLHHPGLVVRHSDNVVDFGCGAGGWLTMPLGAPGGLLSVFATAVPAALQPVLAVNRLAIFYNVNTEFAPPNVDMLFFREGVAAGTTYAAFDLETLTVKQSMEGYFTEPVVYDPQRVLNVVVRTRINTGAQERVHLGCFIIEPTGPVIS